MFCSSKSGRLFVVERASTLVVWSILIFLLAASSGCSCEGLGSESTQSPPIEIPLNNIWTYNMPGTPNTQPLGVRQVYSSLSQQIYMAIGRRSEEKQPIGPGFAVAGTGRGALESIKKIMEQDQMPSQVFPMDTEVSLFFFTRKSSRHIYLKDVRLSKETVTIHYYFAQASTTGIQTMSSTRYLALIPLGRLPVGSYTVNIVEVLKEGKHGMHYRSVSKELAEKLICKSFSFSIEPTTKEDAHE